MLLDMAGLNQVRAAMTFPLQHSTGFAISLSRKACIMNPSVPGTKQQPALGSSHVARQLQLASATCAVEVGQNHGHDWNSCSHPATSMMDCPWPAGVC
jgi:hypothetical protein